MTCNEFMDRLSDWLDRQLPEDQGEAMAAHRASCEPCRRLHDTLADTLAQLPAMEEEIAVPLETQRAWRAAVRTQAAQDSAKSARPYLRATRWAVVAAGLVIVMAGVQALRSGPLAKAPQQPSALSAQQQTGGPPAEADQTAVLKKAEAGGGALVALDQAAPAPQAAQPVLEAEAPEDYGPEVGDATGALENGEAAVTEEGDEMLLGMAAGSENSASAAQAEPQGTPQPTQQPTPTRSASPSPEDGFPLWARVLCAAMAFALAFVLLRRRMQKKKDA